MMREKLLNIQNDLLESKGSFNFYLFLFILSFVIGSPDYPIIDLLPRFVLMIIGLLYLLPIYFLFKSLRDKKQNRTICFYIFILTFSAVLTATRMI